MVIFAFLIILLLCLPLSHAQFTYGIFEPSVDWYRVETKHFIIYFNKKTKEVAKLLVSFCDQTYEKLSPEYGIKFDRKLEVIVGEVGDNFNGFYIPIPLPKIVLFVSDHIDDIFSMESVIRELFIHELTHALTFEPANGFWVPLRWIFGYYILPNAFLPAGAFHESITVYQESYGDYGRNNNSIWFDYILSQRFFKTFKDITMASAGEKFPLGAYYLYGGYFFDFLSKKFGDDKVKKFYLHNSYYFPFDPTMYYFERSFQDHFGSSVFKEWEEMGRYLDLALEERTQNNLPEYLTKDGWYKRELEIFSNKILYISRPYESKAGLKYLYVDTFSEKYLLYNRIIKTFELKANILAFVEEEYDRYRSIYKLKIANIKQYNKNLYIENEKDTGITGVKSLSIIDTSNIIYIRTVNYSNFLAKHNLKNEKILISTDYRKSLLKVSASENKIAIISRTSSQKTNYEYIEIFSRDMEPIYVISNFLSYQDLRFLDNNSLIFSATTKLRDKMDVYLLDLKTKEIIKITDTKFSFLYPNIYSNKVIGISFSKEGMDICSVTISNYPFSYAKNFLTQNIFDEEVKPVELDKVDRYGFFNEITPLRVLMTFFPVLDFANLDGIKVSKLGIIFDFFDQPLEYNRYTVIGGYHLLSRSIFYSLDYYGHIIPNTVIRIGTKRDYIASVFNISQNARKNLSNYIHSVNIWDVLDFHYLGFEFYNVLNLFKYGFDIYYSYPVLQITEREAENFSYIGWNFIRDPKTFVSPYTSIRIFFSTLSSSLGLPFYDEGWYISSSLHVANKNIYSYRDVVVSENYFSFYIPVIKKISWSLGATLKSIVYSEDPHYKLNWYGLSESEYFINSKYLNSGENLKTSFPGQGNNYLVISSDLNIKIFDIKFGWWPIVFDKLWIQTGPKAGMIFSDENDILKNLGLEVKLEIFLDTTFARERITLRTGLEYAKSLVNDSYFLEFNYYFFF